MPAERAVIEIELVPDVVIDRLRDADGTGLRERFEPGSDVHAVAKDVVAVDDHVAEIDADPQLETAFGRYRVVDSARRPLHLDSTVQRIYDAGKIRQQAVAGGTDDPPAMCRYQRVDSAAQLA